MSWICSRTQLDLELIAGFRAQLGGVGLADHQVAVELDLGVEAQAAARFPANSGGGKPRYNRLEAALLDPPPGRSPVLIGRPVGPLVRPRWQRTPYLLHPHHHTQSNALLLQIHDRMPVVTMDGLEEIWLLPEAAAELWGLEALMVPWDPDGWKAIPVDWV